MFAASENTYSCNFGKYIFHQHDTNSSQQLLSLRSEHSYMAEVRMALLKSRGWMDDKVENSLALADIAVIWVSYLKCGVDFLYII